MAIMINTICKYCGKEMVVNGYSQGYYDPECDECVTIRLEKEKAEYLEEVEEYLKETSQLTFDERLRNIEKFIFTHERNAKQTKPSRLVFDCEPVTYC